MDKMFRDLKADEIDVRVARVFKNGVQLLFYKDARVDQNILDETVGPMNWQRRHDRDNANCIVSVWDDKKGQWISKEDTGTESKTEAAKGLASDSFKRACFNWGIGRELYTAPDTTIWNEDGNQRVQIKDGSKCYDRFAVIELTVTNGVITHVVVYNITLKKVVFNYTAKAAEPQATQGEAVIPPVTNETVQAAVDFKAPADKIELAELQDLAARVWPESPIESIFPRWPQLTKGEYVAGRDQIKSIIANKKGA